MIKTTVEIEGMMCSMCEAHINDAIRAAFPVKKVSASRSKGTAEVLSEEPLDEERLRSVIDATGYTAHGVRSEAAAEKRGLFSRRRG